MFDLTTVPVIVAPMAGGPSTPDLVVAAADAGALAFLAAGYKTAPAVAQEIEAVRAATARPFGVNVFVPGEPFPDRQALDAYLAELAEDAAALGVELGAPSWSDDAWADKTALVLEAAPAVASFTFGCPDRALVRALQDRGTLVVVTATSAEEASAAVDVGADAVCVQGVEAGAHRGSWDAAATASPSSTLDLIGQVRAGTDVAVIAAGGIALPGDVGSALAAGAAAVQCGTSFLRCPESGASQSHKDALVDADRFPSTTVTRAFSGREARSLVNRFTLDHPHAPAAYPEINSATRPLRAAATASGDVDRMSLWAGTGHRHSRDLPLAAVIDWLAGGV